MVKESKCEETAKESDLIVVRLKRSPTDYMNGMEYGFARIWAK